MTEDEREAQSKLVRPVAPGSGLPTPVQSAASTGQQAQTKAVSLTVAAPAPSSPVAAAPAARVAPEAARSAAPLPPTPAMSPVPAASSVPATPAPTVDTDADADTDEDLDEADVPLTLTERLRRLPPAPVILTAGSIGSLLFLAKAMTSHTTPVAVLMSSAVVTALIFGVDAVIASIATWRSGQDGESGRALLLAVVGGVAALVSAGAFAGTLVMILVLLS
jgi:hypothetical protein